MNTSEIQSKVDSIVEQLARNYMHMSSLQSEFQRLQRECLDLEGQKTAYIAILESLKDVEPDAE